MRKVICTHKNDKMLVSKSTYDVVCVQESLLEKNLKHDWLTNKTDYQFHHGRKIINRNFIHSQFKNCKNLSVLANTL